MLVLIRISNDLHTKFNIIINVGSNTTRNEETHQDGSDEKHYVHHWRDWPVEPPEKEEREANKTNGSQPVCIPSARPTRDIPVHRY